jgi:murein tripeptide amidase MpaA
MADHPKYIRSGVRAYPFEDQQDGLHPEDINGDGRILQMRIKDSAGDWKVSHLDPRMMEKRQPDENEGQFYRLLPEGKIQDFDGYVIQMARPLEGLDFNRNFPFDWKPENEQYGAGPYPASEPEIKAVVDFVASHTNINVAITFHTFSGVLLRPYSTKPDDDMETEDLWVFKRIGAIGTKHTGYRCVSTYHDFRYHPKEVTTGAFDDWLYDHMGVYTFTIELWDLPTQAGVKERKFSAWYDDHPHEEDQMIMKWIDENAPAESYVEWKPFQHPQLGEVEIGGWNLMYTWRNPPHAFIGEIAQKQYGFLKSIGEMLPKIEILALDVTPLGGCDYTVNLVVQNRGYFPSYTSVQGKKRQASRPVRAELELPEGVSIVTGKRKMDLGHLGGRSNKFDVATVWGYSGTDNRARVEWVLHGNPGGVIKITVKSERAGTIHREITLL